MNLLLAAKIPDTPWVDWPIIAPVVTLFVTALLIVLARAILRTQPRLVYGLSVAMAFLGLAVSGGFVANEWKIVNKNQPFITFAGAISVDGMTVFVQAIVLIATALSVLLALSYLRREGLETPEYLVLLLLSAAGMLVMAHANDLILVFVALEVFSIALYILAAFDRKRSQSHEAGLKYFILGAFSSAVFLYGIALVYGATGTTSITGIAKYLLETNVEHTGLLVAGFALLIVGLGFKISAAPFHMWTPYVNEGAPTPVTAFMASATKVAAFAAFLRIFAGSLSTYASDWRPAIYGLAVISLLVGTIAAAIQTDVKRMLAYSSVAHAGYILIGVQVANAGSADNKLGGTATALFYLLVYAFMALGAFGVVQAINQRGEIGHDLSDYRELGRRQPALAGLMTLFLLAQAGVPFTGGFIAKLTIFRSAVDAGQHELALVGMAAAVIGAFVYLRLVIMMYRSTHDEHAADEPKIKLDVASATALFIAAVAVIALGIMPNWFLDVAGQATQLLQFSTG